MKNEMMVFEKEGFGAVSVIEKDGVFWFVAKDIAETLGYSQTNNMNKLIDADDKCVHTILQNGGNYVNQALINESGLYTAIFGSTLPNAKTFKKWVTSEVLPSIRKTGGYKISSSTEAATEMPKIASILAANKQIAAILGLDENHQIIKANQITMQQTGFDCMKEFGITALEYKPNIQYHTPSILGDMCGLSAIKINKILEEKGLQEESRDNKNRLIWVVTEKGKQYSRVFDTGKTNKGGSPIQQIKWSEEVLAII